ncbi:hypothetical protein AB4851_22580 [Burkholderia sp. 22PA0099]|uniref:hypothetical protein n=1 Tax=Burkholderia sp. 22PA0099 TaxID=3237372 RepID=UPI0039C0DF92
MTWEVQGARISNEIVGELRPVVVLYEYDGPQIFVAESCGRPLLVYVSDVDEEDRYYRLLVVATSEAILNSLRAGKLSLIDALNQPWMHAVDKTFGGEVTSVWFLPNGINDVPDGFKPVDGTLLSHELEEQRLNRTSEASLAHLTVVSTEFVQTLAARIETLHASLTIQNETILQAISNEKHHPGIAEDTPERNQFARSTFH